MADDIDTQTETVDRKALASEVFNKPEGSKPGYKSVYASPENRKVRFRMKEEDIGKEVIPKIVRFWKNDVPLTRMVEILNRRPKEEIKCGISIIDIYAILKKQLDDGKISQRRSNPTEMTILAFERLYGYWREGDNNERMWEKVKQQYRCSKYVFNIILRAIRRRATETREQAQAELTRLAAKIDMAEAGLPASAKRLLDQERSLYRGLVTLFRDGRRAEIDGRKGIMVFFEHMPQTLISELEDKPVFKEIVNPAKLSTDKLGENVDNSGNDGPSADIIAGMIDQMKDDDVEFGSFQDEDNQDYQENTEETGGK